MLAYVTSRLSISARSFSPDVIAVTEGYPACIARLFRQVTTSQVRLPFTSVNSTADLVSRQTTTAVLAGMDAMQEPLLTNCNKPECPVCLSPFTEPKIMFCGHVICRVCLTTWVEARGVSAGCPLCRHRILVMQPPDLQRMEHLAEYVADSLPTHHIIKATARGTVDLTPDTCLRCENLICSSRSSPYPDCTGPRDAQNTDLREEEALDIVNDLSHKVQMMVQWTDYFQDFLLDIVTALRGLVVVNDRVSQLKDQSLQFLTFFQGKITECRTVLLTHQHLLERMRDSRQVVATILMRKPMQERIKTIMTQCQRLHLSYSRGCRDLRSPWITEA